jgi:hypothetical protein
VRSTPGARASSGACCGACGAAVMLLWTAALLDCWAGSLNLLGYGRGRARRSTARAVPRQQLRATRLPRDRVYHTHALLCCLWDPLQAK